MTRTFRGNVILKCTCVVLAVFMAAACATRVDLQVQRTPTLDTTGINRVAVMEFRHPGGAEHAAAARHATTVARNRIAATNHFTMVSPDRVTNPATRENYVDALFTGQVTRIGVNNTSQQRQRRDRNTGATINYTIFMREVEVEFTYQFELARGGDIIGPITRRGRSSSSADSVNGLHSVQTLANNVIDNQLRNLGRDVAPHTITVRRALESEPNRALRPQMDAARDHVRAGNFVVARQAYIAIWESYQSVAAAVNASILLEAAGETGNAAILMQQVVSATGNPLANTVLARLNRELAEQAGVDQFADAQSPVERVALHAISEMQRVLPAQPRVWIQNNTAAHHAHHALANNVIDNMTSTFLRNNVTVIERQMIDLILREQNFHLGGNVSDADFLSIGNLAGANTVVIVNVTGAGAQRRLQVRVLDINAGTVIMSSGTGSEWHL